MGFGFRSINITKSIIVSFSVVLDVFVQRVPWRSVFLLKIQVNISFFTSITFCYLAVSFGLRPSHFLLAELWEYEITFDLNSRTMETKYLVNGLWNCVWNDVNIRGNVEGYYFYILKIKMIVCRKWEILQRLKEKQKGSHFRSIYIPREKDLCLKFYDLSIPHLCTCNK